jgi:hypothetical protein
MTANTQILLAELQALAEHWAFSGETAFRLPELLEELRDSSRWYEHSALPLRGASESEQIGLTFLRRVLLSATEEEKLPQDALYFPGGIPRLLYQWTNSDYFNHFTAALKNDDTEIAVKTALQSLEDLRVRALKFFQSLKDANQKLAVWNLFLQRVFTKSTYEEDAETLRRLSDVDMILAALSSSAANPEQRMDVFRILGQVYSLYARLCHTGYLEWTLTVAHFDKNGAGLSRDDIASGRPNTLAYAIKTTPSNEGNLPNIQEFYRIAPDQTICNVLEQRPDLAIQRTGWIVHPTCPEAYDATLNKERTDLFIDLFRVFNEDPSSAGLAYFIAVPVYDVDRIHRHDALWTLQAEGAFLGWLMLHVTNAQYEKVLKKGTTQDFQELYEDLVDVRYLLNRFAEIYLVGEMDWALQQEKTGTSSARDFLLDSYHHCDGWQGTRQTVGDQRHAPYFWFLASRNPEARASDCTVVQQANYGSGNDRKMEGFNAEHIRFLCVTPEKARSHDVVREMPLVFKRHDTTALPAKYSNLHDYGVRVAKAVDRMLESAELLEKKRQHDILVGRAQVSHDFSFTIRTTLSDVRELAEAVESLRNSPSSFPIESFAKLPPKLRSFTYPARLYAVALSNACKYEHDDTTFLRQIPHIDWIERSINRDGISASLVLDISENIAKPLAKGSLEQFDQDSSKVVKANPVTTGIISALRLQQLGKVQVSLLVGVMVELLREAFQHCLAESPGVDVVLSEDPQISITITNSCKPDARWEQASNGNQASTLDALMRRLPHWKLTNPNPTTGKWTRSIILQTEAEQ